MTYAYDPRCTCSIGVPNPACPVGAAFGNHPMAPLPPGATVGSFHGKYHFLSNFYEGIVVCYDGVAYPTSEHAYAAAKTLDYSKRLWVAGASTPGEAKRRGRGLTLRPGWEAAKLHIMWTVLLDKFLRNPWIRADLLATGEALLIEGNTHGDRFWGQVDGTGENHLGRLLMGVRAALKGE